MKLTVALILIVTLQALAIGLQAARLLQIYGVRP